MLRDIKIMMIGVAALMATGCSYDGGWDEPNPGRAGNGGKTDTGRRYGINVGGTSSSAPATRVEYDGVTYKWSPDDGVGLYMVSTATGTTIVRNARLKSVNTAASQFADFEGEITEESIRSIVPEAGYDYYSYFPYDAANAGFPNVAFTIPGEMNLTPDVFPTEYGFMIAEKETTIANEQPLTWLDAGGQQRFGERIGFRYRHVFAYLEVSLQLNFMSHPVTKLVVTCEDGLPMSGTANIDLTTGNIVFAPGASNSITVNIGGRGMDIRSASDFDRIYIPINPALAGKRLRFDFYDDYGHMNSSPVTGGTLQSGMKTPAKFGLTTWVCNFGDLAGGNNYSGNAFSHEGYDFWCFRLLREGSWITFSDDEAGDRGEFQTSPLNLANRRGASGFKVRVTLNACGDDPEIMTGPNRRLKYGASPRQTTPTRLPGSYYDDGEHQVIRGIENFGTSSFEMNLTPAEPCIAFTDKTWGLYHIWIREIKIEYVNDIY